ncbi:uncharacterized protein LOC103389186 [Cynoglossus semilaevis]|uniref:uncharacterized protein LOC103389186 n=1 Tax=Cynoglossus semilaevis TaxID=244447 RepID=UPI0004958613|nr:uncharacterized protein LOC103389186 [Cynoglossus semilaevis]
MGHKPAEAVTRNAVVNMTCVEEPALILIRHCQDMKKQETRLRFITLLLLLGCGSLFLYISCAVLWFHREPAGTEHTTTGVRSSAYSRQEGPPETQVSNRENRPFHIYLQSVPFKCTKGMHDLEWNEDCSPTYDSQRRAIKIPYAGAYFIYTRVMLSCVVCNFKSFSIFAMEVDIWNKNSNANRPILVQDSMNCQQDGFKNIYMGELFDMSEGDHITVRVKNGTQLIKTAFFGAHMIS